MIHKRLQADVVSENRLRRLADTSVARGSVRRRWVELGEQETGLGAAGIADDESRQREAVLDEFLREKSVGFSQKE